MPAGLPGATAAQNTAGPTQGQAVIFDLASGPKGSPFDNDKDYANATAYFPLSTGAATNSNSSCGALATGIGFGALILASLPAAGVGVGNFHDAYVPGVTKPDGNASANSTYMYIGGGRCYAVKGDQASGNGAPGQAQCNPYTAGFGIGAAGQGGARDGGAGPA